MKRGGGPVRGVAYILCSLVASHHCVLRRPWCSGCYVIIHNIRTEWEMAPNANETGTRGRDTVQALGLETAGDIPCFLEGSARRFIIDFPIVRMRAARICRLVYLCYCGCFWGCCNAKRVRDGKTSGIEDEEGDGDEVEHDFNSTCDLANSAPSPPPGTRPFSKLLITLHPLYIRYAPPTHASPLNLCIPNSFTRRRPVLLSLIVTLTPPLQYALEHNSAFSPVNEAVGMCRYCVVPVTLVVYFGGGEGRGGRRLGGRKEGEEKKRKGEGGIGVAKEQEMGRAGVGSRRAEDGAARNLGAHAAHSADGPRDEERLACCVLENQQKHATHVPSPSPHTKLKSMASSRPPLPAVSAPDPSKCVLDSFRISTH
ncbi:hypothetical protein CVT25_007684 [Psilocybe cyanescens]|uniref:Uncharacterized protein n=1 Tax=Psilocybe cyanescens TaxID=93625 RepID=A0A409XVA1_PSICY|nr:hypothetical protein CVT25_007684 [Psilocybe cyanescens]